MIDRQEMFKQIYHDNDPDDENDWFGDYDPYNDYDWFADY